MPFKLYVDSRFRKDTGGSNSDSEFTVELPHPIQVKGKAFVDTILARLEKMGFLPSELSKGLGETSRGADALRSNQPGRRDGSKKKEKRKARGYVFFQRLRFFWHSLRLPLAYIDTTKAYGALPCRQGEHRNEIRPQLCSKQ